MVATEVRSALYRVRVREAAGAGLYLRPAVDAKYLVPDVEKMAEITMEAAKGKCNP